jgi:hypothetical protein
MRIDSPGTDSLRAAWHWQARPHLNLYNNLNPMISSESGRALTGRAVTGSALAQLVTPASPSPTRPGGVRVRLVGVRPERNRRPAPGRPARAPATVLGLRLTGRT